MKNGKGDRLLTILAAVLSVAALSVTVVILIMRDPPAQRFESSVVSAGIAARDGRMRMAENELLRASRYASTADDWRILLQISASLIPPNPLQSDFELFTVLAGKAASAYPGRDEFPAFWAWGLLRSGDLEKLPPDILSESPRWDALRSEIRLALAGYGNDETGNGSGESLTAVLKNNNNPEFYAGAGAMADSAELTLDAALLYARQGRMDEALRLMEAVMNGARRWASDEAFQRSATASGAARLAYDSGRRDLARIWLEDRIDATRLRRVLSWRDLALLGDLYWQDYAFGGAQKAAQSLPRVQAAWDEAAKLLSESGDAGLPEDSWRLWVNRAVLLETLGQTRRSQQILEEALTLFPGRREVVTAWAMMQASANPAMAERIVNFHLEDGDPVLGVVSMMINHEAITPRLYEARLWSLFEAVTDGPVPAPGSSDRRLIVAFILQYMASRRDFDSLDVAVDRYSGRFPADGWIYSWRLSSDAARGYARLSLVSRTPGGFSPYDVFRNFARDEGSWRALHDAALFAVLASQELNQISGTASVAVSTDSPVSDRFQASSSEALLAVLAHEGIGYGINNTPLGDRLNDLKNIYLSEERFSDILNQLESSGSKGRRAEEQIGRQLRRRSSNLLENARADIQMALQTVSTGPEKAGLLYLDALALEEQKRSEEAAERAEEALDLDPDNERARLFLASKETS